MCRIAVRCEGDEFLVIELLGRLNPDARDYWDGNWLQARVDISAGCFTGSICGAVRTDELVRFHDELVQLQSTLQRSAEFETMERWLSIRATGDGKGHMQFRCVVRDSACLGNTLDCILATDQTFTSTTVDELASAIRAFPIVGNPPP